MLLNNSWFKTTPEDEELLKTNKISGAKMVKSSLTLLNSHSIELLNHLRLYTLQQSPVGDAGRPWQPNVDVINGAGLWCHLNYARRESA